MRSRDARPARFATLIRTAAALAGGIALPGMVVAVPARAGGILLYEVGTEDSSHIPPMLPANATWRFGLGGQKQESKSLSWGWAAGKKGRAPR